MPYALLVAAILLADPPCLPGAKLIKRGGVEQCVTAQGKLHGMVRVHSPTNGKVILEQRWENDQQDGPGHTWHDNGKMESESFYKAGQPDGAWKAWWPSGTPAGESQYRQGARAGTWTLSYRNGARAWQRVYGPDGKLKSEAVFGENGKPETRELTAAVVARVMHDARPSLRLCYEGELSANPKLEGKLRVYFEIGPSGAVQGQKLEESTLRNGKVEQCVLQTLAKVEFPRPPDGEAVPISYPLVFHGDPNQLPPPDEEE
ncbi:MAG TPA: AgmX/PglI C-terminal domain-containing protein [Myxococcaceae bacterium]|jgi:antitoxin component YwqK of YwqJK toxin-antitoxin module